MVEKPTPREYYARTYDVSVHDWTGEIDFYLGLARAASGEVLELAVGTGRIAIRLAQEGMAVTGLDRSPEMLDVGRAKAVDLANVSWVEADMRSFELDRRFGLVIIPGHSFQNLLTADDQFACVRQVAKHLLPDGLFVIHVDHQNIDWLGAISPAGRLAGIFEAAESFVHPDSGGTVLTSRAWTYRRSDQTALVTTRWEELGPDGKVVGRVEKGPTPIHCVFRYEMEHVLARAGFELEALYGDFLGNPLTDGSSETIWVAKPVVGIRSRTK